MTDLPDGWSTAALAAITSKIGSGATPTGGKTTYKTSGVPLIRSMNVHFSGFTNEGLAYIDEKQAKKLDSVTVRPGDVLLNITGASIGRVTTAPSNMNGARVNQHVAIIRLVEGIESKFVAGLLGSPSMQRIIAEENYGVTRQALTKSMIEEFRVPVPPLAEQQRIIAKIDSLFAKSKRARDQLDHIPRLVEKYKQAILAAAFQGSLTLEWRMHVGIGADQTKFEDDLPRELNGQSLPSSWTIKFIPDAASNHDGKRIPVRASDRALRRGEFPYYGASGVIDTIDDYLFDGDFLLIGEDGANLISRSTPIAFLASGRFWVNNHAHVLQAGPDTSNAWLCHYVNMIDLIPFVTGTAQPKLTQAALNRIAVPLPSIREQQEILHRIGTAFAWIDRLAAESTNARKLIEHLDQAVLVKAFRGELVPQDPNDEPASVLLERIRAERAAAPAKVKARGPKQLVC
jgi:type I restriction enzyme S subunit